MYDITNRNFYDKYDDIVKDITTSDFIAIDCEFSGLLKHQKYKPSLFDSPAERYQKLRLGTNDFLALQIGISVFTYNRYEKYEVSTYTFYLVPRSYSGAHVTFSCEAKCMEFLCEQNFDFNKVFHSGVTFACASDEENIRKEIEDGSFVRRMKFELSSEDRELVHTFCRQVNSWLPTVERGESITLNVSSLEPFLRYLVWEDIETQNRNAAVTRENWANLRVRKVNPTERKSVNEDKDQQAKKNDLLDLVFGFTRIIKTISTLKKPIIGHNPLLDLIMIYKMFVSPLPTDYNKFKKDVIQLFPEIYDTKLLSHTLRGMVGGKDLWGCNTLAHLYKYFKDDRGTTVVLDMPVVEYKIPSDIPKCEHFHDSGFDSYCTGYVFLKIAHMFSMWDENDRNFKRVSLGNGPVRYFGAVRAMKNRINLVRSQVGYIHLEGPDPEGKISDHILLESRGNADLDLQMVSHVISKYDNADIKLLSSRRALIASSSDLTTKMIFRHFLNDNNMRVFKYRVDDKRSLRWAAASAIFCGIGGLVSYMLLRKLDGQNAMWSWKRPGGFV